MENTLDNKGTSKLETKDLLKWGINILLPLIVFMIPTSATFTPAIKMFLVITVTCVGLMATENVPTFSVAIILPILYILILKDVDRALAYKPWTTDVPWLTIGGSVVTLAMQKTGLLKRLAYKTILICGGTFNGIIFGMMFIGMVVSICMGLVPRALLLGAFALGICNALDFELGSREASALGTAAIAATLGPGYLYYTGSGGTIVTMGIAEGLGVAIPTWGEFFFHMALPQMVYIFLTFLVIIFMFKPKENISSKDYIKEELDDMGKMSTKERKLGIITAILIGFVIASSYHSMTPSMLFCFAAAIFLLPGVNVMEAKDIKDVNIVPVLFITTCMTIGFVSGAVGFGKFISDMVYPMIAGSTTRIIGGLWSLGIIANFALTPTAAYSVFTEPVVQMAQAAGLNPVPVIYAFVHGVEQLLFPYEYVPVLVIYGFGMISFKNFIKYNAVRAAISFVCVFAIFIPWWKIIGIF